MTSTVPSSFYEALAKAGINYSGPVIVDERIHRHKLDGDKQDNFWYVLRRRGEMFLGGFGHWRLGVSEGWCSRADKDMTYEERKQLKQDLAEIRANDAKAKEELHVRTRAKIAECWKIWPKATEHPYFETKKVKVKGDIRICTTVESRRGWLVVPMYDGAGTIQTVQYISPEGEKSYQYGAPKQGYMYPVQLASGPILICEGLATGLSIAAATGWTTMCAMDSGNLMPVAKVLRKEFPDRLMLICGDNDESTEGNPGRTKAEEAAKVVENCIAVVPNFPRR